MHWDDTMSLLKINILVKYHTSVAVKQEFNKFIVGLTNNIREIHMNFVKRKNLARISCYIKTKMIKVI